MNKPVSLMSGVAMAACLLLSSLATAQAIPSGELKANKSHIKKTYQAEKKTCALQSSNAKAICMAEAKGKESVALAELAHRNHPNPKNQHQMQRAKSEATYKVAKQKCGNFADNAKDVCIKEAKAALTVSEADADVQLKTAQSNAKANDDSNEAKEKATADNKEVRNKADAAKKEARLTVEEEKCNALAGSAKTACLSAAKAKFDKL